MKITLGEFDDAYPVIQEASAQFRVTNNKIQLAPCVYTEAVVAAGLGKHGEALRLFRESLDLYHQLDDWMDVEYALEGIVRLLAERGDPRIAARLWGGMESLRERERVPDYPLIDYAGTQAALRAAVGDEAESAEFKIGYRLPLASLTAEALHLGAVTDGAPIFFYVRSNVPGPNRRVENSLTARQLEILRLVAAGQSNREIARRLEISPRTVERHLSTIFLALGSDRRSGAVATAAAAGLL